MLEAGGKW